MQDTLFDQSRCVDNGAVLKAVENCHVDGGQGLCENVVEAALRDAGVKLAQAVTSSSILDFIELSDQYGIAELTLPEAWVGKTIRELNIRAKYGVNIIAVRENGKINVVPDADEPLPAGCVLVAVGANDKLTRLRG